MVVVDELLVDLGNEKRPRHPAVTQTLRPSPVQPKVMLATHLAALICLMRTGAVSHGRSSGGGGDGASGCIKVLVTLKKKIGSTHKRVRHFHLSLR